MGYVRIGLTLQVFTLKLKILAQCDQETFLDLQIQTVIQLEIDQRFWVVPIRTHKNFKTYLISLVC